uniref:Peptidase S1 domain-containing protein n=1 Tax=Daphnia galeata TaxID=27404 RepID=A0A8J2RFY7_9CRUS|nr:unnamed protein product [Daphnia galeata]
MRSLKLIFVLLIAALSTASGIILNNRIINGDCALQGQFPYVVSITENDRHFCGGFIYNSRWVVTAASCVEGKLGINASLNVVVGQLNAVILDEFEQKMAVDTIILYPQYDSAIKLNDIALIRVTAEIQFDYVNVDFILYEEVNYRNYSLVMGWGAFFEGGVESVNLRYGAVTSILMDASTKCGSFPITEFNYTTTICAGATITSPYPAASPCQYDEGSPLVQDFVDPDTLKAIPVAVGIFSKNKMCTYTSIDGVGIYTRLSAYDSWLLYTAGLYTLNNRIIQGGLATQGQFPYVASVTENGRHFCGGFIYSSRYVVTAASCVEGKPINVLNVVVGQLSTITPDVNEQTMVVYTVTVHPEYDNTTKMNDIALIRLTAEIQFDYVNVDFILYQEANIKNSLVMGWGATFEGGYESVNLRFGAVLPQALNVSQKCGSFPDIEFNLTTTICAGPTITSPYPGGSPCQYDEGSPLVQDFEDPNTLQGIPVAVGIFSKNKMCTYGADGVGIYTRLSTFDSWLRNTAGQQPVHPASAKEYLRILTPAVNKLRS